jgi:hypothetical protein
VTKVSADGGSLIYSTFLGDGYRGAGIAVLPNGNAIVAGSSPSTSYPVTPDAYQAGSGSSYLSELNASGTQLVYSTLFGVTSTVNALALDPDGDIWIAGQNSNGQLPMVKPLQSVLPLPDPLATSIVSFVALFDPSGHTLKFSSFLGGTANSLATGLAVDQNHHAHVSGAAEPGMFTTPAAYLGEVAPDPANSAGLHDYVSLIDSATDAPAMCIGFPQNSGLVWGPITVDTGQDIRWS